MKINNQNQLVLGRYSIKDIKNMNHLVLKCPLTDTEIQNLKYLKDNTTINLTFTNELVTDEANYLLNIIKIFRELVKYRYTYNIIINITNRELLRQSKLISKKPTNVVLSINNDDYIYSLNEYNKEENKLESLIAPIRNANLSPFEKYLAVYDIVKKYKPYKASEDGKVKARELRYILDDNNPYIVCRGFSKLLYELLKRVNINSKYIFTNYDISDNITPLPIEQHYIDHSRNIIKLDDEKYNIHGIYIADSTWDNHPTWNLYTNSVLTFDRKKEAKHLEKLQDEDLLLDFHNIHDFTDKIKYFIKRRISYPNIDAKTEEKLRIKAYKDLYKKIMEYLFELDKPTYKEFHDKYHNYFLFNQDETSSNRLEMLMTNFLTDYAKYIIPLSNNKVDSNTIISALINIKKVAYSWQDEKIKAWLDKTISDNLEAEAEAFPYVYDASNLTEAYVEKRNSISKK